MRFKTFAALDLETSGFTSPKITELAIIACERAHCDGGNGVPRVLHKLIICINPKSKIHPNTTDLTGLDNEDLMNVSSFNDTVLDMLDNFLSRLPQPVCLVAHNGLKFDFPILMKEMLSCGEMNVASIFCADSLIAFREMFPKEKKTKIVAELSCPAEDRICIQAAEDIENKLALREMNETTPERRTDPLLLAPKKQKNTNPLRLMECSARRKLNFSECEIGDESVIEEVTQRRPASPLKIHFNCRGTPKTYALGDIYEYLHGFRFPDAHRAEADAMALLECLVKASAVFDWIDANAISLSAINPR